MNTFQIHAWMGLRNIPAMPTPSSTSVPFVPVVPPVQQFVEDEEGMETNMEFEREQEESATMRADMMRKMFGN